MKNKHYLKVKEILEQYIRGEQDYKYDYEIDVNDMLGVLKCFETQIERALALEIMYSVTTNINGITHTPKNTINYISCTNGIYNEDECNNSFEEEQSKMYSNVYEQLFKCVLEGIEPKREDFATYIERYASLDNMLEWYGYELHNTTILDCMLWNIYDISNKDYTGAWVSLNDCAIRLYTIQLEHKDVDISKVHYTTCVIEWQNDKTQDTVIVKSNDEVIESEDEQVFYYGLSYDLLADNHILDACVDNEWKVLAIVEVEN